jgi:hypothetical protein
VPTVIVANTVDVFTLINETVPSSFATYATSSAYDTPAHEIESAAQVTARRRRVRSEALDP